MLPVDVMQQAAKARVPDGAPRLDYRPLGAPRRAFEGMDWSGKGFTDYNDYEGTARIELVSRIGNLIDEARDAAARNQHDRYAQALAKLRAECDTVQRQGWTLPWARVVDATDPARPVTYAFISEFLSEWKPAPTLPADGVNERFPSAAGWPSANRLAGKLVVISDEVDQKLGWLDLLAQIEASTLLLSQLKDTDPLVATLVQMRDAAEKELRHGVGFDEYVTGLAEQIRKERAPVVHGAKAVTLFLACHSGDLGRITAARFAYLEEAGKHIKAQAWKTAQLDKAPTFTPEVIIGGTVKALPGTPGKVGGYLVRFTTANDPDVTGDFFTKSTELGAADKVSVLYNHGLDGVLGVRVIGKATLRKDDVGLWAEAQLALADEYEKAIYELAKAGRLGWSSGAVGHAVTRRASGKAKEILSWHIGEASLTPQPAEPRNRAAVI